MRARLRVAAGWAERADLVVAGAANPPAEALLIRPDGYAAWVADGVVPLAGALRTWFGEPARTGQTVG
jgi:hypothetical protein